MFTNLAIELTSMMIKIFLFILLLITSNIAIASVKGQTLICDKDRKGYKFISEDQVVVSSINFNTKNINSINHSYKLTENAILIKKSLIKFNKDKNFKTIGWIFRRTLDYVSLDYVNGDWSRRFLWSCKITSAEQLDKSLKNTIYKFIKASGNKKRG